MAIATSNRFAPIASTIPLIEGMIVLPHVRKFLDVLIPHCSPSVILTVVGNLGELFLVPGLRSQLLKLPPRPEPSLVPLIFLAPSSPPSPLPEPSEPLSVTAPSLVSISKDTDSPTSYLPASPA